ncbi:hypothetical protein Tco_1484761 [Tanacetum coccineum]
MAGPVAGNQITRRVIDDLINFSGETSVRKYMKFFFEQQISERRRFINCIREEVQTSRHLLAQLTTLIVELEAYADPGEVFDTLLYLRDDARDEQARLGVLNDCITQAEEQIETKEEHVRVMEVEANDVRVYHPAPVVLGIVCGCYRLEFGEGPSFFLDKLSEVAETPSLGDKMKYVFGRSRSEDESLGDVEGATKYLEHMRAIVGRDAVTLGELEALSVDEENRLGRHINRVAAVVHNVNSNSYLRDILGDILGKDMHYPFTRFVKPSRVFLGV